MDKLVTPTVNLNGTSREALVQQYLDVLDAANRLLAVMAQNRPHPRDYQTMRQGAWLVAVEAWDERAKMIATLTREVKAIAMAIHQPLHNADGSRAGQTSGSTLPVNEE